MKGKSVVSFFWRHIKPYKWYYLLMVQAPILFCFHTIIFNYALKLFIDSISKDITNYSEVICVIFILIAQDIFTNLSWRVSDIAEWIVSPKVRGSLISKSYEYIQGHSYSFFQNNLSGIISSKLKTILESYDKLWYEVQEGSLPSIIKIILSLTSLFFINVNIAIFTVTAIISCFTLFGTFSKKINKLTQYEQKSKHNIFGQITDKIINISSILSFSAQKKEAGLLKSQIKDDFVPRQRMVFKYSFFVQMAGGAICFASFSGLLFYIIFLKKNKLITIGDISFILGILYSVFEDLSITAVTFRDFIREIGELQNALSILNLPQQNKDIANAVPLILKSSDIEFKNIFFSYGASNNTDINNNEETKPEYVFKGLNLKIRNGEKIGIIGYSGSGKSSIINLLLRYFRPQSGQILIGGQDINKVTQDSLRRNIAIIPQDTILFHRSILENIHYGNPDASYDMVIEASKKAHIHEYIMQLPLQYDTIAGERGTNLSGGQRQRIAIARAILKDAPILLLDEATSSLDSDTENLIQETLNTIFAYGNKTVIAIAHRLSTLKNMDRIIVLDKGHIIEEGKHNDLVKKENGLYKKLYDAQKIML